MLMHSYSKFTTRTPISAAPIAARCSTWLIFYSRSFHLYLCSNWDRCDLYSNRPHKPDKLPNNGSDSYRATFSTCHEIAVALR